MSNGHDQSEGHAAARDAGHQHGHSHTSGANQRRIGIAALLTGGFMFAEAAGGIMTGSLALIADAAHMMIDAVSLGFAWWAFRVAGGEPTERRTFGNRRLPVLVAFANAIAILMITAFIVIEAAERFADPVTVLAGPMMVVAVLGLVVNIVAFLVLMGGQRESLNVRGALIHVAGDMLGSLGAITAAAVILWTGWMPIDPILSVFVALLILRAGLKLARESGHILLEGAPVGLEPRSIRDALMGTVEGIAAVRHVHVWALDENRPLVTLNVELAPGADGFATITAVKARLKSAFGVNHATVEVDPPGAMTEPAGLPRD
ncbi:cation diffusion facilitator family transporter [Microbaculum marinisediminis]|uniref:Cation diffusion facilitator family transporter n=1 Tax=Microbaculum marinisediminis TaxID=2931392 RepID=A0AAW5R4D7_9HYPH|nr:cation diffusion facilitator family transporter [Microbaculum sp. A6E488]MCT8973546.1 cation diffusion facilitator family transporter [Microbaculum sp. A6E488]